MKVNERRTVVGEGFIGHCVSPQPWREIDAHEPGELVFESIHQKLLLYRPNSQPITVPQVTTAIMLFLL